MRLVIATCLPVLFVTVLFLALAQNALRRSSLPGPSATSPVEAAEKIARLLIERNRVYRHAIPLDVLIDIDTRSRMYQLTNDLEAALNDTPTTLEDWKYIIVLALNQNDEYINAIPEQLATKICNDPRSVELRASIRRYLPVLRNSES